MFAVRPVQTHSMLTRDGIRLDADVYAPNGEGPFPVLLMRQPYGRAIASTIVYAHPRRYAACGYIVVIQDVRGRGTSEGEFSLFAHEVDDGEDTVKWAARLPGSDGQVGMYGFSYQGMTQLYAAQARPSELKTIAPAMTGYHPYEDWAYENGAFCFQLGLTWGLQLAAETARIAGKGSTYQKLAQAARCLPLYDSKPACPEVLEGMESFFHDWVAHPKDNEYWQSLTPQMAAVDLPMLHVGGWYDPYLRGDLRLYEEMRDRSDRPHHLCIGPWGHIPWGHKVGEIDFGPAAISPVDQLQIQWFDHVLKGKTLAHPDQPVYLFEMGRNQWRRLVAWPNAKAQETYFLQSTGLAHIREDSGKLLPGPAETISADMVVHDPWNPVPALGGHSAIPSGAYERTKVDSRGDVLTYTSLPLAKEMRVVGRVELVCAIASSAPSYDLCAVLSRVGGAGQIYNLTQGYCRIDASENVSEKEASELEHTTVVTLLLHPTCFSLTPGESFRLSLSAACFPAYLVNPGTGAQPKDSKLIDAQIVTLAITLGGSTGARLKLPLVSGEAV